MSVLTDAEIKKLCTVNEHSGVDFKLMISPYIDHQVREHIRLASSEETKEFKEKYNSGMGTVPPAGWGYIGKELISVLDKCISYGQSSHGYDIRVGNAFKIFTNINSTVVDAKNFDSNAFVDYTGDICIIPPNSFVLAHSVEHFNIPDDVIAIVLAKSTYARTGMTCICTPLEAGWSGTVTLEFANNTPLPMYLYAGEGAAQVLFFQSESRPDVTYADRGGKYQDQTGITIAKA